ncbi:MAG: hypothetical protein IT561_05570 [Alphaproteobacteria bacterium]|nr:hypothetical protein [Alphaproteobacteria bacterium]
MSRAALLIVLGAVAGCSAAAPPPAPQARAVPADDGRITALLAYHTRVVGYRTMCWDPRGRRLLRCYDI